jgi:hypothetical protein
MILLYVITVVLMLVSLALSAATDYFETEVERMTTKDIAEVCSGECPFEFDCRAMDCEECMKLRADEEGDARNG